MNSGLTTAEVKLRLTEFGPNLIQERARPSRILQFLGQFKDFMVIILIIAAIFAYVAGENVDAIIIISIVFINATIGFIQEFKAERAIEALKKMLAPRARVLRDGKEMMIDAKDLVPGDLVILNEGDKVSADAELIEENELFTDESVMTGESVPVKKNISTDKRIFMGTQITHGTARAIITHTGMRTEFGKIAALTSETKKDKSPLQKELAHIGIFVGKITIGISFILFLVGIFAQNRGIIETLLFSVSVAVAAVPEGLPATITVALALGVQRLARKNAIVKQLSSVETLGSTTVICSDKTGTLTKNEMTVQELSFGSYEIKVSGVGYVPEGSFSVHHPGGFFEYDKKDIAEIAYKKPEFYNHFSLLTRAVALCNNARLTHDADSHNWHILGDPTEGALITLSEKAGLDCNHIYQKYKKLHEFPFDSLRKRMSVVVAENAAQTVYVKGAPDALLPLCTFHLVDGIAQPLLEEEKQKIAAHNEQMASRALRTIAVAYKEVSAVSNRDETEKNLIFIGLVGMIDPPREEVKEAVKLTHKAGIRIFIITGDHGLTAHAIARELGIAKSYGVNIITGELLGKMSDEKLLQLLAPGEETIFARVNPEHKLRIVDALKKSGEVVAVTGDGVNDAPALKRADIGVAMGITGTDVSKEAANMVLTDDSFSTIVTAVIEGRTIYENMKKFIYYIFSSNIGELVAIFTMILLGLPSPLTAVLILLINTLTDVFPSLALGVEPVERSILERPPRKSNAKIMERGFIVRYCLSGIVIGLATAGAFLGSLWYSGWRFGHPLNLDSTLYMQAATMAFVVLNLIQMVQAFNSRSETLSVFRMKFFENLHLLLAIAFTVVMTIAFVEIPFFQKYLKTISLSRAEWLAAIVFSLVILIFEEVRKLHKRHVSSGRVSTQ